jgi:D-alanyl-D-alanine carboxypeptidase (penicillin-binding protein 5/6)
MDEQLSSSETETQNELEAPVISEAVGEQFGTRLSSFFVHEPSHLPVIRQLVVALSLLGIVFGATYIGSLATIFTQKTATAEDATIVTTPLDTNQLSGTFKNPFDTVHVQAESAFVWDVKNGKVLFNKNADTRLPLASITKLMTALVSYELLDDTDKVHISENAIRTSGDSGFKGGETFKRENLTDLTLITSSNDGAVALSEAGGKSLGTDGNPNKAFIEAMNLQAEKLSLTNMHFNNETGLDISKTEAGAYGTAREVSLLMEYIITHYPTITALTKMDTTSIYNTDGEYHLAQNTNEALSKIDGLIASKTGYTELAHGNLTIAFDAGLNRPIIVTVLNSTQEDRFSDVIDLVNRSREFIAGEESN